MKNLEATIWIKAIMDTKAKAGLNVADEEGASTPVTSVIQGV